MKRVKPEIREIMICDIYHEEIKQCEQCCDELCLDNEIYCKDFEHFCEDCKTDKMVM